MSRNEFVGPYARVKAWHREQAKAAKDLTEALPYETWMGQADALLAAWRYIEDELRPQGAPDDNSDLLAEALTALNELLGEPGDSAQATAQANAGSDDPGPAPGEPDQWDREAAVMEAWSEDPSQTREEVEARLGEPGDGPEGLACGTVPEGHDCSSRSRGNDASPPPGEPSLADLVDGICVRRGTLSRLYDADDIAAIIAYIAATEATNPEAAATLREALDG